MGMQTAQIHHGLAPDLGDDVLDLIGRDAELGAVMSGHHGRMCLGIQ